MQYRDIKDPKVRVGLPKWVQEGIENLMRDNDSLRKKLAVGPENSDTFAEPYADPPKPLGRNAHIRYGGLDFHRTFDVNYADGQLYVRGNTDGGQFVVMSQSDNCIRCAILPARL